jgi:nucleotide-binding universal stress UspA family protein
MAVLDGQAKLALHNILFATDFSASSDTALRYAVAIARRYDSHLHVSHVIRPDTYQLVPPEATTLVLSQARRYAEQEMGNLLISGRLRDIPHQVLLGEGELWPVLSGILSEHEIDLIVVGTHGRTGVRKLLLGSVAEEIFRLSSCPVLTVGPHVAGQVPEEAELRHILYATDFTAASERAAAFAFSLAQEHQAHLTLMHAVGDTTSGSPHNAALIKEFFVTRLRALLPRGAELWCEPEFAVQFDKASHGILAVAAEKSVDLIVLGVGRTANFPGHLPPATAYEVVCQSLCPVLTVRG